MVSRAKKAAPPAPDMTAAQDVLERVFGYKSFRSHQAAIVQALLAGRDALVLMPTGGGKSLCYQIPAMVRPGTGIVVSPLIALMQDQVDTLREAGVAAAFLNSTLDREAQDDVERRLRAGALDLVYVAPERLVQPRTLDLLAHIDLALFAIDEAHCVSQWGHDFRPEYRQLRVLAERFPHVPRIALTATADGRTRDDIVAELQLQGAETFVASFDRPNIRYTIAEMGSVGSRDRLWQFISTEHPEDAGIVYCQTRKAVDETAAWLAAKGRRTLAYHAGLTADVRRAAQERFLREDGTIVVATVAFGMGIDKPDVRFVAHLNLPKTVEAYYQETGRAGRDGEPADAWMAYGLNDIVTLRQWIEQSEGSDAYKQVQRRKLDQLVGLCEITTCRRQSLLAYFGETRAEPCGNCDNCLTPPETRDATEAARKALSAVFRTGERFGVGYLVDVLTGKADERVVRNGHDRLGVFGLGRDLDGADWRSLFRQLVAAGHLAGDSEGHGGLVLTARARPLLRGEETFRMRRMPVTAGTKSKTRRSGAAPVAPEDREIFDGLRSLRAELAAAGNVPPYVVFHDRTLAELAARRPKTLADLAGITGLGERKIARYGAAILERLGAGPRHPKLQNRLSRTVNETLALHLDGHDAEEIARRRGIEVSTIFGHLAEAVEAGIVEARDVLGLDEADIDEILEVFDRLGTLDSGKIGPAHSALDGRYCHGQLKCLMAELA